MLNLDKIRARLDRDAVCHCGELIRHHSQLSGHTAVEMTDPSHEETHALLDEIERLRSEFAAAQPVVEWRRLPPAISMDLPQGWGATRGRLDFVVYDHPGESVGWKILVQRPAGRSVLYADGPETGPAGKAACEAAYRRACGLPAIPPCAG